MSRLRFWRRKEPEWREIALREWQWPARCAQDGTACELCVHLGDLDLSISLFVGLGDVAVTISSQGKGSPRTLLWELSELPMDGSSVHRDVLAAIRHQGCDHVLAERLAHRAVDELARRVTDAKIQRDQRLFSLPVAADLGWSALRASESGGGGAEAWTAGMYTAGTDWIAVRVTYQLQPWEMPKPTSAMITSTRGTRRARWELTVPLDGLCCNAAVEFLETCGWPNTVAGAVGRAIAVKARGDWLTLQPAREQMWRELLPDTSGSSLTNPDHEVG